MQTSLHNRIVELTGAESIERVELIQPLWNDYGTLSRAYLRGGDYTSIIVKHIRIPDTASHPRGFASDISKQRKIRSYHVEAHWYQQQNAQLTEQAPTPRCLESFDDGHELALILEDLSTRDFVEILSSASLKEMSVVLHWLASFHAGFVAASAEGLWPSGTYWHLATRPEELANIEGTALHRFASLLDARLRLGKYQTLVHGDAKLANFLFTNDRTRVAAVDFQYVGRGCAMKDIAYFVGSCLAGPDCERLESKLLAIYFKKLREELPAAIDADELESEWRSLYPLAWADFERFMSGWSPRHHKLTAYSDQTTRSAIYDIADELCTAAKSACLAAGQFLRECRGRPLDVSSKGFASKAADVVTQIDIEAQALILDMLQPTIERYDLGLLAEEGEHDDSRLHKHAFWAIDPLDGTQNYVEGRAGFATSIALVAKDGSPILGVAYDPVRDELYESAFGNGVRLNGKALSTAETVSGEGQRPIYFADRSLRAHPNFDRLQDAFDIRFEGGAVSNALQLLTTANSFYCKAPKMQLGGCAIWDLAAISLMLEEHGGGVSTYDGSRLHLNRPDRIYFNDLGFVLTSAQTDQAALRDQLQALD